MLTFTIIAIIEDTESPGQLQLTHCSVFSGNPTVCSYVFEAGQVAMTLSCVCAKGLAGDGFYCDSKSLPRLLSECITYHRDIFIFIIITVSALAYTAANPCLAGHTDLYSNGSCTACPAGSYADLGSVGPCQQCAAGCLDSGMILRLPISSNSSTIPPQQPNLAQPNPAYTIAPSTHLPPRTIIFTTQYIPNLTDRPQPRHTVPVLQQTRQLHPTGQHRLVQRQRVPVRQRGPAGSRQQLQHSLSRSHKCFLKTLFNVHVEFAECSTVVWWCVTLSDICSTCTCSAQAGIVTATMINCSGLGLNVFSPPLNMGDSVTKL